MRSYRTTVTALFALVHCMCAAQLYTIDELVLMTSSEESFHKLQLRENATLIERKLGSVESADLATDYPVYPDVAWVMSPHRVGVDVILCFGQYQLSSLSGLIPTYDWSTVEYKGLDGNRYTHLDLVHELDLCEEQKGSRGFTSFCRDSISAIYGAPVNGRSPARCVAALRTNDGEAGGVLCEYAHDFQFSDSTVSSRFHRWEHAGELIEWDPEHEASTSYPTGTWVSQSQMSWYCSAADYDLVMGELVERAQVDEMDAWTEHDAHGAWINFDYEGWRFTMNEIQWVGGDETHEIQVFNLLY